MLIYFRKYCVLGIVFFLCLTSCSSGKSKRTSQDGKEANIQSTHAISGSWTLIEFHDHDISIDRSNLDFIPSLEIFPDEMKIEGSDGCNQIYASLSKLINEEIRINAVGGTKVGCKMKAPYDMEYRSLLAATRKFRIDESTLLLLDGQDKVLLEFDRG